MKITEIKTWCLQVGGRPTEASARTDFGGGRNWLFIKVMTDEGVYGVGEGSGWRGSSRPRCATSPMS
jgi:galactonate dehydratase